MKIAHLHFTLSFARIIMISRILMNKINKVNHFQGHYIN